MGRAHEREVLRRCYERTGLASTILQMKRCIWVVHGAMLTKKTYVVGGEQINWGSPACSGFIGNRLELEFGALLWSSRIFGVHI